MLWRKQDNELEEKIRDRNVEWKDAESRNRSLRRKGDHNVESLNKTSDEEIKSDAIGLSNLT